MQEEGELTRDQKRSRRKRKQRSRTIPIARVNNERHLDVLNAVCDSVVPEPDIERPINRGDCVDGPRPCPFVSCKYHLYLDASPKTGSLKINFPDLEVWELKETCALDIADRQADVEEDTLTLEKIADLLNMTRERVRQILQKALNRAEKDLEKS